MGPDAFVPSQLEPWLDKLLGKKTWPSGQVSGGQGGHGHNYGKSPFLMGKSTNFLWQFSIANS
jgi:hypothetical protein